jgi:hypothetical protein
MKSTRCASCKQANDSPSGVTCSKCRAGFKARYSAKREAGRCAACDKRARPERTLCASCKERVNARHRNQCRQVRREALEHYGGQPPRCACCGEARMEFLAIDHIDGGGQAHRRKLNTGSGTSFYFKLRKLGWPEGLRVLCHNCNVSLGMYGYCPHQDRASASVK